MICLVVLVLFKQVQPCCAEGGGGEGPLHCENHCTTD